MAEQLRRYDPNIVDAVREIILKHASISRCIRVVGKSPAQDIIK